VVGEGADQTGGFLGVELLLGLAEIAGINQVFGPQAVHVLEEFLVVFLHGNVHDGAVVVGLHAAIQEAEGHQNRDEVVGIAILAVTAADGELVGGIAVAVRVAVAHGAQIGIELFQVFGNLHVQLFGPGDVDEVAGQRVLAGGAVYAAEGVDVAVREGHALEDIRIAFFHHFEHVGHVFGGDVILQRQQVALRAVVGQIDIVQVVEEHLGIGIQREHGALLFSPGVLAVLGNMEADAAFLFNQIQAPEIVPVAVIYLGGQRQFNRDDVLRRRFLRQHDGAAGQREDCRQKQSQ